MRADGSAEPAHARLRLGHLPPEDTGAAQAARGRDTLVDVANIEKRGSYTPRRVRQQRADRLAVGGTTAGVVGVAGIALSIIGVVSAALPIIALIIAALCAWGFMATVGKR